MTVAGRGLDRLLDAAIRRVQRLVGWCQGAPLPIAEWFEPGLPIALGVPLFVALPFTATGPLRFIVGCSLTAALPLSLILSALAMAPIVIAWRRVPRSAHRVTVVTLPLVVAAFSVLVLYRRAFAGLTNYAGADAGVHIFQYDWFVHHAPGVYVGFVSMYAFQYWFDLLTRTGVYWSLCAAYYFSVAVVAAVPCIISLVALEPFASRRAWWLGATAMLASGVLLAWLVVLPQQHYHQTDGFFAHLFALIPLLIAWLVDSVTRARLWRWLGLIASLGFYRYTYGLNLADFFVAVAALLFADSFAAGQAPIARWLLRFAPLPFAAAALLFLRQFQPQLASYGWIVPYDLPLVVVGECVAALTLAIVIALAVARRAAADWLLARVLRFPLVFVVVNAALTWIGWRLPHREPYYVYKYPMHAVVLAAGALVVVTAVVPARLVANVRSARSFVRIVTWTAAGATAVAAVMMWRKGYAPLEALFRERALGRPPFSSTRPLADLGAARRIKHVLTTQHKQFGGYITPWWPMFNFMNAWLGYYNGGRAFWDTGHARVEPGFCVFWDEGKVDWWSDREPLPANLRLDVASLAKRSERECSSYRAAWNHAIERKLCHVCF